MLTMEGGAAPVQTVTMPCTCETRRYFDSAAPGWDSHARQNTEKLRTILALADLQPGAAVLDVGCGTGVLFPAILERAPRLLRAIDLSPAMAQIARGKTNDERVRVTAADYYQFEETGFDLVIAYNAYPHFLHKAAFAARTLACLKPGGRLVIAHGAPPAAINAKHAESALRPVSCPLRSCQEEAARLGSGFRFDIMVQTENLYVLSGRAL